MAIRVSLPVILLFLAFQVMGQNRSFRNNSFESPFNPTTTGVGYFNAANTPTPSVDGWNTTSPDGTIEIWATGHLGVSAADGNQFVELNGNYVSRLYQNVCLVNGEILTWEYQHRGRESSTVPDEMELNIYDETGTSRIATLQTASSTNTAWMTYTGSYLVNIPTGKYQFSFEMISTASVDQTMGNFLDDITITMAPFIEFSSGSYSGLERYNANHPELFINGYIPAGGSTVTVQVSGGTATSGSDFSLISSFVIPEGLYSPANPYAIPLSVIEDLDPENNETISLTLISADNGAQIRDADCSGGGQVSSTYTILDDDIYAGRDTTICQGGVVRLSAATSGLFQGWTPSTSLLTPADLETVGNPADTIAYKATAFIFTAENLVINGDFSAGNVGFTSSYSFWPGPDYMMDMSLYQITTNPSASHGGFDPCGDNTTGTGNMMVVNGATTENEVIWSQTVNVVPGRKYAFSASLTSVYHVNPAELQFNINGSLLGTPFTASSQTCDWRDFSAQWTADAATAVISIVNQNTGADGNDFAIDDIYFAEIIEISDEVTVNVQECVNAGDQGLTFCESAPGSGVSNPIDLTRIEEIIRNSSPGATIRWFSDPSGSNAIPDPGNYIASDGETVYAEVRISFFNRYYLGFDIAVNDLPVADAGPAKIICPDGQVVLEGSVTGGTAPYTISWSNPSSLNDHQILTPEASPQSDTVYVLSVIDGNACTARDTVQVSLADLPVPGTVTSSAERICTGESVTVTITGAEGTVRWYESNDNTLFTELTTGVSADQLSLTVAPSNSSDQILTRYYTASAENSCGSVFSDTVQLEISPMPEAPVLQNIQICPDNTAQIGFLPSDAKGDSIRWEVENSGIWTYFSSQNLVTVSPAATTNYRVILLQSPNVCLPDTSNVMTVEIANPESGMVSGPAEECSGSPVSLTLSGYDGSIQWQESTNLTDWFNTGAADPAISVIPAGSGNYYYRAIVSFQGCADTTAIHTLEVKDNIEPELSIQVADNSLCDGESFEFSIVSVSGNSSTPVIEWFVNEFSTGQSGDSIILPDLADGNLVYAVATFSSGGCLTKTQDTSNSISVQVSPKAIPGDLSPANSSLCFGESATLNLANSSGTIQFQWSSDAMAWNYFGTPGQTSVAVDPYSFLPDGNVPAMVYVRARLISACDTVFSSASEISSSPVSDPDISIQVIDNSLCEGQAFEFSVSSVSGNSSTPVIEWFVNEFSTGQTGNSIILPDLEDGNLVYAIATFSSGGCLTKTVDTSNSISVQVSSYAQPGDLSPANSSLCFGESATLNLANSSGIIQFQWSSDAITWNDFGTPGQTSVAVDPYSFLPDGNVPAMVYVRARLISACDTVFSSASEISSSPVSDPNISIQVIDSSLCEGQAFEFSASSVSGNSSTPVIEWFVNEFSTGQTGNSIILPDLEDGNLVYAIATFSSGGCLTKTVDTSNSISVQVSSYAQPGDLSPAYSSLCFGESATLNLANSSGIIQFQWSSDAMAWNDFGTPGQTSVAVDPYSFLPDGNVPAIVYVRARLISACDTVFSSVSEISSSPVSDPNISIQVIDNSLCEGQAFEFSVASVSGTSSIPVIEWFVNGVSTGITGNNIIFTDLEDDNFVYAVATFSSGGCLTKTVDTSNSIPVQVSSYAQPGDLSPANSSLCFGESATLNLANSSGTIQFQWSSDAITWNDFGTPGQTYVAVDPYSFLPDENVPAMVYVRARLISACDTVFSSASEISSSPVSDPDISIQVIDNSLCEGQAFEFSVASVSGTSSIPVIEWFVNGVSTGITGNNIIFTDLEDDNFVYAVATFSSGGCLTKTQDTSNSISVQVSPKAIPGELSPANILLCSFAESATLNLTNSSGVIQFQWSSDQITWNNFGSIGQTSVVINPYSFLPDENVPARLFVRAQLIHACDTALTSVAEITGSPEASGSVVVARQCESNQISLNAIPGNSFTNFVSWQTTDVNGSLVYVSNDPELTIANPESFISREYTAIFSQAAGCTFEEKVFVEACMPPEIDVPNAMTPNEDGENDTFWIRNIWYYPDNILKVYNRWGNLVYKAEGYNNEWDGTRNGVPLPTATYYYVLDLGNDQEFNGSLTIIR